MAINDIIIGDVSVQHALTFILIIIAIVILGKLVYVFLRRVLDKKFSRRRSKLFAQGVQYLIIVSGIYYGVYYILGLNLLALATSLGIIGIAIAFSAQQILQNFLAALLIGITRTIQIGDWVQSVDTPGINVSQVKEITLTNTSLRGVDGRVYFISNSILLNSKIVNYTKSGFTEIPIQLTIPSNINYQKIKEIILQIAEENTKILPNITKEEKIAAINILKLPYIKNLLEKNVDKLDLNMFSPRILISNISGTTLTMDIKIWIREINKKDEIVSEFLEAIHKKFNEDKIELK
jgi:small-conductance mechanosensitive channel